jgi:hypothetical protein
LPNRPEDFDPDQFLSEAARRRIDQAYHDQFVLGQSTEVLIQAAKLTREEAEAQRQHAAIERARMVLRVVVKEYHDAGLSRRQVAEVIAAYIANAQFFLSLTDAQRNVLKAELFVPPDTHESRKAKVDAYCRAYGMKREHFAKDVLGIGRTKFFQWRENPLSVPDGPEIDRKVDKLDL